MQQHAELARFLYVFAAAQHVLHVRRVAALHLALDVCAQRIAQHLATIEEQSVDLRLTTDELERVEVRYEGEIYNMERALEDAHEEMHLLRSMEDKFEFVVGAFQRAQVLELRAYTLERDGALSPEAVEMIGDLKEIIYDIHANTVLRGRRLTQQELKLSNEINEKREERGDTR